MISKVFLSHSSNDKEFVEKVAESIGYERVFLDKFSLPQNKSPRNEEGLKDLISRSMIMVVFVSHSSVKQNTDGRHWVNEEIQWARDFDKEVILMEIEEGALNSAPKEWRQFHMPRPGLDAVVIATEIKSRLDTEIYGLTTQVGLINQDMILRGSKFQAMYLSGLPQIGKKTLIRKFLKERFSNASFVPIIISVRETFQLGEIYNAIITSPNCSWKGEESISRVNLQNVFNKASEVKKIDLLGELIKKQAHDQRYILLEGRQGIYTDSGLLRADLSNLVQSLITRFNPMLFFVTNRVLKNHEEVRLREHIFFQKSKPLDEVDLKVLLYSESKGYFQKLDEADQDRLIRSCRGFALNAKIIAEKLRVNTDVEEILNLAHLWNETALKEFTQGISFSDSEKEVVQLLLALPEISYELLLAGTELNEQDLRSALESLQEKYVIEGNTSVYRLMDVLIPILKRNSLFSIKGEEMRKKLECVAVKMGDLINGDSEEQLTKIKGGIEAAITAGTNVPAFLAAFVLPSALLWAAQVEYDKKREVNLKRSFELAQEVLESKDSQRLSDDLRVIALEIACLSATRLSCTSEPTKNKLYRQHYSKCIGNLEKLAKSRPKEKHFFSKLEHIKGFNTRLIVGNLRQAYDHQKEALKHKDTNTSASREIARISLDLGFIEESIRYAGNALVDAPNNAYLLDILISGLIHGMKKDRRRDDEILSNLKKLELSQDSQHSFFETRSAEYAFLVEGDSKEARKWIEKALRKTASVHDVLILQIKIELKNPHSENIEKLFLEFEHRIRKTNKASLYIFYTLKIEYLSNKKYWEKLEKLFKVREYKEIFVAEEREKHKKEIELQKIKNSSCEY